MRWQPAQRTSLRRLYQGDTTWLHASGLQSLNALDVVELNLGGSYTPANGAVYPDGEFGDHLVFEVAEGLLAVAGENLRDGAAGTAFDLIVGVEPVPAEPIGENASHGRLAGAAISDQDEIHGVVAGDGCGNGAVVSIASVSRRRRYGTNTWPDRWPA